MDLLEEVYNSSLGSLSDTSIGIFETVNYVGDEGPERYVFVLPCTSNPMHACFFRPRVPARQHVVAYELFDISSSRTVEISERLNRAVSNAVFRVCQTLEENVVSLSAL